MRRLFVGLLAAAATATAAQELPQTVELSRTTLQRCGDVQLRVFAGLINIGRAGLYLQDCGQHERVMGDVAKQYSVHLARSADGDRLTRMAREGLEENHTEATRDRLAATFSCMTGAYRDAEKGRRYDVRYLPGHGLQLWLDEELLADCPCGPDGARYFSIWFGDEPFNTEMKETLLEQARNAASRPPAGESAR